MLTKKAALRVSGEDIKCFPNVFFKANTDVLDTIHFIYF